MTPPELIEQLTAEGSTIAFAESLTGGLLADAFITVPGASAVVRGGIVAYATDVKASLLGVESDLLADRGPVDGDVALAMAAGARARMGATYGLATTGVAGPDPQGEPVGTVYVAVSGPGRNTVQRLSLSGTRAEIRAGAVAAAIALLASGEPRH